jgi:DNA damage-binding protein 1
VRLTATKSEETGSNVEVLQTFQHFGAITDLAFCGEPQALVTCSGLLKDGSLRVLRSGVPVNEEASIDLPGIKVEKGEIKRGEEKGWRE